MISFVTRVFHDNYCGWLHKATAISRVVALRVNWWFKDLPCKLPFFYTAYRDRCHLIPSDIIKVFSFSHKVFSYLPIFIVRQKDICRSQKENSQLTSVTVQRRLRKWRFDTLFCWSGLVFGASSSYCRKSERTHDSVLISCHLFANSHEVSPYGKYLSG